MKHEMPDERLHASDEAMNRPWRNAALATGGLVLAIAWLGPLPRLAQHAFYAHMTMHMLVVAAAAPLLALGLAGGRFDPVRRWPAFFPPVPISLLELLVVWAFHLPALHHAASHGAGRLIEQGSFLACGLLIWTAAFGGSAAQRRERAGAGVAALLLTSMHMTLLGALIGLAPRPLYHHAGHATGMTALEDQHLGGAVMLVAGGVVYLAGGLWLMAGLLREKISKGEAGI